MARVTAELASTEKFCSPEGVEAFTRALEEKIQTLDVKPLKPPKSLMGLIGKAMRK